MIFFTTEIFFSNIPYGSYFQSALGIFKPQNLHWYSHFELSVKKAFETIYSWYDSNIYEKVRPIIPYNRHPLTFIIRQIKKNFLL